MMLHGKNRYVPAMGFHFLTPYYDTLMKTFMPEERLKGFVLDGAGIRPGDRVLDFGCGTATLTIMGKRRCPEASFVGLDVDERIVEIARMKVAREKLDIGIDIYDGDRLPYDEGSFDRIVSSFVFHHLSTDKKKDILKQSFRILRAGGEIHVFDFGEPRTGVAKGVMKLFSLSEPVEDNVKGHIPLFMAEAGFKEVKESGYFKLLWCTASLYSGIR